LIAASQKGHPSRKEAILRLAFLAVRGGLLFAESRQFADALWSDLDAAEHGLPANTGLIPSAFAQLPSPDTVESLKRVERRLLGKPIDDDMAASVSSEPQLMEGGIDRLMGLANLDRVSVKLQPSRAAHLFDRLMAWCPPALDDTVPFENHFRRQFFDNARVLLGQVLSKLIVPAMDSSDLTTTRGEALIAFIKQAEVWSALVALPHFVSSVTAWNTEVELLLRRSMVSSNFQQAASASLALVTWGQLAKRRHTRTVPWPLIEHLISAIETRHEPGLQVHLQAAGSLYLDGFLKMASTNRLVQALDDLRVETRYERVALDTRAAVSVSLVRSECAKLAKLLLSHGRDEPSLQSWLSEATLDALPEVRFSI